MASSDVLPRFFKVFISHLSSGTMVIPASYYEHFPSHLPKTAILQGPSGSWNISMMYEGEELSFGNGWSKFVEDNHLSDGDFLTFVYNGDSIFEVSIYGSDGCKENREMNRVKEEKEEHSVCSLTSKDTASESEMVNTTPRSKNKGKKKREVDDSDEKEESVYSLSSEYTDTDTCSELKMVNPITKSRNKGKAIEKVSDEDSDSDYIEAFGSLDFSESSESDCSYSPKKRVINQKPNKRGRSKSTEAITDDSLERETGKKGRKIEAKIKNPEAYLEDPNNIYFETAVKNRKYELLIHAQLVKDYCLKFENPIHYLDKFGKVEAKTATWGDQRVCVKRWMKICERNKLKKEDRILCELLRKRGLVYAIKLHIFRGQDL